MRKIAHIADIHLRDEQYGSKARGRDFFCGFYNAVKKAIEVDAKTIICAGDVVDSTRPSANTIVTDLNAINKLLAASKAHMYVVAGNHDCTTPHWCALPGLTNIHMLPENETLTLGPKGPSIYGCNYCTPDRFREILQDDKSKADILVWHGEIKEFTGYPKKNAIEIADFPENKWQLIAMGDQHIHKQQMRESDRLIIAYPGSTELCSSSEEDEKKMFVYTFDDERKLDKIESVAFETRPVQRFKLYTDVDLEQAIASIKPNAMLLIEYDRSLTNALPRINAAISSTNIVRTSMLPDAKVVEKGAEELPDEDVPTFAQFTRTHVHEMEACVADPKLEDLYCTLADPALDHRYALDKFCEERLEGKLII